MKKEESSFETRALNISLAGMSLFNGFPHGISSVLHRNSNPFAGKIYPLSADITTPILI